MLIELASLLILGLSGSDPPDIKNFTPVFSRELEFRIDDYKKGLVGKVVVYQNPNDKNEFVRVYYRQVAIVSERAQENSSESDGLEVNLSNLKHHSQQEAETLNRVQRAMDAFAYVQWRTVRDQRTGQDIREDFLRSWLLDQNGNWALSYGYDLNISPFSEPSQEKPDKRIIVGIKFILAGQIHIVRVDQNVILSQIQSSGDAKGKEGTDEKK